MSPSTARPFAIASLSLTSAFLLNADGSKAVYASDSQAAGNSLRDEQKTSGGFIENWDKSPDLSTAVAPYLPDSFRGQQSDRLLAAQLQLTAEGKVVGAKVQSILASRERTPCFE